MSEKTENTLRQIWWNETREKIKNHLLWLRWSWKEEDRDFSNLDFTIVDPNDNWSNITIFRNSNISEANFQNSDIRFLDFSWAIMKWTDLRWTKYDIQQFSKEQIENVILTDDDYKKYQERKRLEEENKKLKTEVKKQEEKLEKTSDKQTDKLIEWFERLKEDFALEEKRWAIIAFSIFISLFFIGILPVFDIFAFQYIYKLIFWWLLWISWLIIWIVFLAWISTWNWKEKNEIWFWSFIWESIKKSWLFILYSALIFWLLTKFIGWISEPEKRVFNINIQYWLVPVSILLLTFLYFAIYQYSKAKKLRIENQNKIALLHGFQAIRAEKWDWVAKTRFYDNIANVVFTSVYDKNEKHIDQNLPIDRIIDLVKTTIESTTKR